MNVLGFDIGGTKCAVMLARVYDDEVKFLKRVSIATSPDWELILGQLSKEAETMLFDFKVDLDRCRIGISCGGPLDTKKGLILSPPNLVGWDKVPIVSYLSERFNMPVKLQNDADACALAEWKYGAGKGTQNMIFLTFGTGLGAGLILNGMLYTGANNMAGEVGHIRMAEEGPVGYGKEGSFEGFCSGGGIKQLAQIQAGKMEIQGLKASYIITDIESITTKDVAIAAEAGHGDALDIFKKSGYYFGKGLSILIDILNPEVIVAGSIFARAGKFMIEEMNKQITKEALPMAAEACEIKPAELGEQIGDYAAVVVGVSN